MGRLIPAETGMEFYRKINGRPASHVVGVMPSTFGYPSRETDVWELSVARMSNLRAGSHTYTESTKETGAHREEHRVEARRPLPIRQHPLRAAGARYRDLRAPMGPGAPRPLHRDRLAGGEGESSIVRTKLRQTEIVRSTTESLCL
jgi:hypothetical protein